MQSLKNLSKKGHFVKVSVPRFKMNAKINLFEIPDGKNKPICMFGDTIGKDLIKF